MSCAGCGSSGILPGSLSARNRAKIERVRGYSGSGILKAQKVPEEVIVEESPKLKIPRKKKVSKAGEKADKAQAIADELHVASIQESSAAAVE